MSIYLETAQKVLEIEAQAVNAQIAALGDDFERACEIIHHGTQGHLIVTGLGKSGHIGHKIAATFASTGTPAFFVHPTEAGHGDIGMITERNTILALSYSGGAQEIITIFSIVKKMGVKCIAITGDRASPMARASDVHLYLPIEREACPLRLAPTSSSTAMLALCDALAIAVMKARKFTEEDFARSHPYGRLGRRLLTCVGDLMHKGEEIPLNSPQDTVQKVLFQITDKRLGATLIVDKNQKLLGIYTDGDLRRSIEHDPEVLNHPIQEVMNQNPTVVDAGKQATSAMALMRSLEVTVLPVVDKDNTVVGLLHMHDLLQHGI